MDNTVISNFAQTGKMEILLKLPFEFYTTEKVKEEWIKAEIDLTKYIKKGRIKITESRWEPEKEIKFIKKILDQKFRKVTGEVTCILVAKARNFEFASDDKKARRVAKKNGIKITGTVGLLKEIVRYKILSEDEANKLLKEMKEKASFWYRENKIF